MGLDSNVAGDEAAAFKLRLDEIGFQYSEPSQEDHWQVTVAKQRTMFQTQARKAGEVDVSHKDFVCSWGLLAFCAPLCGRYNLLVPIYAPRGQK